MKTIKLNNLEWYVIAEDEKTQTLLLTDVLSKDILNEIVDDKRYMTDDNDIVYNNDTFDNDWENSYIRRILNTQFKVKYLKDINLEGEVRLLTKEEVEHLPANLKYIDNRIYWTMSPYDSYDDGGYYADVWAVYPAGALNDDGVTCSNGVRPIITIKKNSITEISEDSKENTLEGNQTKITEDEIINKLDKILDELEELRNEI